MRLRIVKLIQEEPQNFEAYLHFGKVGEGHRCRGHYTPVHDLELVSTDSIAATIFIRKSQIVLYHWHTLGTHRLEDETIHPLTPEFMTMEPGLLFNTLMEASASRIRRLIQHQDTK